VDHMHSLSGLTVSLCQILQFNGFCVVIGYVSKIWVLGFSAPWAVSAPEILKLWVMIDLRVEFCSCSYNCWCMNIVGV